MRHIGFSRPDIAHTKRGIKHLELIDTIQPTRHTKATAAAIMCVKLSSLLYKH